MKRNGQALPRLKTTDGQALRPGSTALTTSGSGQAPRRDSGQAAISLIFLVGGTILLVGVTLAFLIFSFITSTFGFQAANRALGVAFAGANDAMLQISKNINFPGLNGCREYAVALEGYSAAVTVTRSWANIQQPTCDGFALGSIPNKPGIVYIISEATVFGRGRKVFVIASVSPEGRVAVVSIRQEVISFGGGGQGG